MLLQNKNAVIYGAGGSLGGAVAKALAAAGAQVFLTGLHLENVQQVANEICAAGGRAEAAVVDAMDEKAIEAHIQQVKQKAGTVDISYNAIGVEAKQNIPLVEMALADFLRPVNIAMHTQFLTATAAGRVMIAQGSGVILSLTATPAGIGYPLVGGFGPACCAMESFSRDLASELGPHGVRVVNMRSGGSPDSRVFAEAIAGAAPGVPEFLEKMEADTMLKKLPPMANIANTAVFLASDLAGAITGVTIDITCGTTNALNYRMPNIPLK
jgi:NAD(P)-dependent dehydrogenase (short-subunit alcohol dehydrogenase family)